MIDRILDRFARSPLGRKLESEQKAEDLAARRGWAEQRVRLRLDSERRHPALREAQAAAAARERALEAELLLAREARAAAARDVTTASLQFDAEDGVLVRQLRTTADPRIRELKWRLVARGEAARAATRTSGPHVGAVNVATLRAPEIWGTNAPENARVMEAVTKACHRLDALEVEVLDDAGLSARMSEIEASVPAPTEGVPTYHRPDMTPAETRERAWREEEERR
jgi:hypothetical protein